MSTQHSKTNTERLEQQESNSWTPMSPTKYKSSSRRRREIIEGSEVINLDWVNHQTCSLSHNIHVVSGYFIMNDYFPKFIRKIIPINIFFNLYTESP